MQNTYPAVSTILDAARGLFDTDETGYPVEDALVNVHPEYVRAITELVAALVHDDKEWVAHVLGLSGAEDAIEALRQKLNG